MTGEQAITRQQVNVATRDIDQEFLENYYNDPGNHEKPEKTYMERLAEVKEEMTRSGTYKQTFDELQWGGKTAWRNAARCSGRIVWKTLKVQLYLDAPTLSIY